MINKTAKKIILCFIIVSLCACGETSITIDESTYEPKIVINGYLYPEKSVSKIRINRNFPIGTTIDKKDIALSDAEVVITDLQTETKHYLSYNNITATFEYTESDLNIDYGNSYQLDVSANIDGIDLQASSITTVPDKGLTIDLDNSVYGDLLYREKDEQGDLITPRVAYQQSDYAAFYLLSISALEANLLTFIYENPFEFDIRDAFEEGARIEDFQYQARWTRPENQASDFSIIEVTWFQIWFYGPYRLILYAGDTNFYHFYNTHRNVQQIDGNLHEPIFDIDGDGIGVFGSAVTDTVYLHILINKN